MVASKAQQAITAERRAKALALKIAGANYEQIAKQLGYADRAAAYKDIERALTQRARELDIQAEYLIALEVEKLDAAERSVWAVLRRRHTVVSQGRVIYDDDGQPMLDDDPVLRAVDRLVKISESRRRLLGLDEAVKIKAEVRNVDALDAEIEQLVAELAGRAQGTAPQPPAG